MYLWSIELSRPFPLARVRVHQSRPEEKPRQSAVHPTHQNDARIREPYLRAKPPSLLNQQIIQMARRLPILDQILLCLMELQARDEFSTFAREGGFIYVRLRVAKDLGGRFDPEDLFAGRAGYDGVFAVVSREREECFLSIRHDGVGKLSGDGMECILG